MRLLRSGRYAAVLSARAHAVYRNSGRFIRIRSAIYSKRVLFDIGVAGPLAGFVFLIPALGVGTRVFESDSGDQPSGHHPAGRACAPMAAASG